MLSSNARNHWSKDAHIASNLRKLAFELAKDAEIPPIMGSVHIRVIYYPPDRRKRDSPNLLFKSSKPAIDGFVDFGVIPDDNDRIVKSLELLPSPEIVKGGQMVIEIEEL